MGNPLLNYLGEEGALQFVEEAMKEKVGAVLLIEAFPSNLPRNTEWTDPNPEEGK